METNATACALDRTRGAGKAPCLSVRGAGMLPAFLGQTREWKPGCITPSMALPQQARRLRHNEGDSLMKRMWTLAAAAAIAVALFTGCSKKADEATTSADSLLSP